ncbi:MAG: hypothetical protein IJF33_01540 [Clostridia bacterium]|nr:hypothetical protein [Clostridia bacterium]
MIIRNTGEDAYFAASNSARGFCSYYPQCFDAKRIGHVYAIKGGPGTGKSRFLREIAEIGVHLGWQCEYIYCSSDPDSLDGVILTGNETCIALVDATAPHVYEPSLPGAREEIVNLGDFWDPLLLSLHGEEIRIANAEKAKAYRQAYRYLCGMGEVEQARDELISPYIRRGAITAFARKLMQGIEDGEEYSLSYALIKSVGMRGEVAFDTYLASAQNAFVIKDYKGSAQYLMQELGNLAVKKRLQIRVSHDPISPEKIDGLFLCDSHTAFVVLPAGDSNGAYKKIDMRRFVEVSRTKKIRRALSYSERMRRAMLDGALEALDRVREIHFGLEEIYISAMDFSKKEKFTKAFAKTLFGLQNGEGCDTI